jgi:hypothetical protein
VLRVADGLDLVHLDGEAVGFVPATGRVVRLNPAATSIVAAVEAGFSWDEITGMLVELGTSLDATAARDDLVESGVLLDGDVDVRDDGEDEGPGGARCATELSRPHCADPVGASPDAIGFALTTPTGPVSFRTDDAEVGARVAAAFRSGIVDHTTDELGWAVSAHVEPPPAGGRGARRLHELRHSGAVIARTTSVDELVEWSVHSLALRLLDVTPGRIPVVGAVERRPGSVRLWCGDTADDLRTRGVLHRRDVLPLPALVVVDGVARTPAAVAGAATTVPDPGPVVLVLPDVDGSSRLARILASVPGDLVRNATTEQLTAALGAVPWEVAAPD